MIDQYLDWLKSVQPSWVSLVILLTTYIFALVFAPLAIIFLMVRAWGRYVIFVPFVCVVAYSWYVALFQQ